MRPMNRNTSAKGKSRNAWKKPMQASTVRPARRAMARGAQVRSPPAPTDRAARLAARDSISTMAEDSAKSCGAA